MPQMAPLMWTTLFIFFTVSLFISMIQISFSNNKIMMPKENTTQAESKMKMNWKW